MPPRCHILAIHTHSHTLSCMDKVPQTSIRRSFITLHRHICSDTGTHTHTHTCQHSRTHTHKKERIFLFSEIYTEPHRHTHIHASKQASFSFQRYTHRHTHIHASKQASFSFRDIHTDTCAHTHT